jgi:hypothetical protein
MSHPTAAGAYAGHDASHGGMPQKPSLSMPFLDYNGGSSAGSSLHDNNSNSLNFPATPTYTYYPPGQVYQADPTTGTHR